MRSALLVALFLAFVPGVSAQDSDWDQPVNATPQAPLWINEVTPDVYGPDLKQSPTGRPYRWEARDGQPALGPVKPNAYGPGVGMDAAGKPVKAMPSQ